LVINPDTTIHILPWDVFLTQLWNDRLI